jgi:DNA-binding transcriptional LysR family regulator
MINNKLNLNDLAIFALVVTNKSFTKAAQEAGLSKAWVSLKISHLENILGLQLLKRTTRSLSLTQGGEILFEHCQKMLKEVSNAEDYLRQYTKAPSGKLVITCPGITGQKLMPVLLDQFMIKYPEIHTRLIITDELLDLTQQGIDFAFRTGKLADSTLISRFIGKVPRCMVASPAYLANKAIPKHPDDLKQHQLLKHSLLNNWPLKNGKHVYKFYVKDAISESNSLFYLLAMSCAGKGIAFLPYYLCAEAIKQKKLIKILPKWGNMDNEYYLIYHKEKSTRYINQLFKDFMLQSNLAAMIAGEVIG